MLTTHFRMHAEIASLIDPWYGHRLRCGSEAQRADYEFLGPEDGRWKRVLSAGRVVFIPSPHEMTSKYHDTEARRIVSLLKYLRDSGGASFKPEHVGVVTPWRTQIGLIRNLLGAESNLQEVNIDTVERFQGSENRIILVSMAVYHPAQLALLRSPGVFRYREEDEKETEVSLDRKLLVTLSRAKQQILFFGDERVLKSNPHYASVIERMQRVEIAEKGVWGL
jgi:superfamily I DNA and/or RNA helicase